VHRSHENDRRLLEARMLVDQCGGLETVHARHVDVEQDRGEIGFHEPSERLRPGTRMDEVLPEDAQDRVVAHEPGGLVVDEQDVDFVLTAHVGPKTTGHSSPVALRCKARRLRYMRHASPCAVHRTLSLNT
jgi:hypothetical protein